MSQIVPFNREKSLIVSNFGIQNKKSYKSQNSCEADLASKGPSKDQVHFACATKPSSEPDTRAADTFPGEHCFIRTSCIIAKLLIIKLLFYFLEGYFSVFTENEQSRKALLSPPAALAIRAASGGSKYRSSVVLKDIRFYENRTCCFYYQELIYRRRRNCLPEFVNYLTGSSLS